MMEAASTSETLVNIYQTTRLYIPEDNAAHASFCIVMLFYILHKSTLVKHEIKKMDSKSVDSFN
jgi:hypothetical protein